MTEAELRALKETVRSYKGEKTFEFVLGRSIRKEDLSYESYLKVIEVVRAKADKEKVPIEKAAKKIVQGSLEV